jgi:hypothetical protein
VVEGEGQEEEKEKKKKSILKSGFFPSPVNKNINQTKLRAV